jgi:NADPH:quinone reductase-like Zn-dependent oxidoreductase
LVKALAPNGRYLFVSFKMVQLLQMLWTKIAGGRKVICALSSERPDDLTFIKGLIEDGRYKPIVDRRYLMTQAAEAHRCVEQGHKKQCRHCGGVMKYFAHPPTWMPTSDRPWI